MPVTEEDMIRKAAVTAPVQQFFHHQAQPDRDSSMVEVGAAADIGPEDAVPLLQWLNMLVEIRVLRVGPPAGGAGPTCQRT